MINTKALKQNTIKDKDKGTLKFVQQKQSIAIYRGGTLTQLLLRLENKTANTTLNEVQCDS